MARKMTRGLVALSSSAIAAVYFAGFVATRAADAGIASAADASTTTVPIATQSSTTTASPSPTAVVSASTPATTTATPPTAATGSSTAAASSYADGTYSGTGTSRRGNVTVSVTVGGGKITNVTITNITTQYPVSRIASLPAQVINRQSSQVDNISGATYSAQAFRTAIQIALAKATA